MIVAIDGPAASGKGTLARRLAAHLGLPHLDTGLLYRAVARAVLDRGEAPGDRAAAERAAAALDVRAIDPARLRDRAVGEAASVLSAFEPVRFSLLAVQRRFAEGPGGAVLDGRDIGTVVCPDAGAKLFVTASAAERARRRFLELSAAGDPATYETVLADVLRRDARDSSRAAAPLRMAPDAVVLDTTGLDPAAAFAQALAIVTDAAAGARRRLATG